jgi:vacuolar protein sorting-associated protein 13A/C
MFDFASNVTEGVRNTTTLFDRDPLDRLRRPRFIAKDGVVRPYSEVEGTLPPKDPTNPQPMDNSLFVKLRTPNTSKTITSSTSISPAKKRLSF